MKKLSVVVAGVFAAILTHAQTTHTVTSTADSGAGTLRDLVSIAASGDTIEFDAGLGPITLSGSYITINKNLTVSDPEGDVVIDGGGNDRIFHANGSYTQTFVGIAFTNATVASDDGGAMLFWGGPTVLISNCAFRACTVTGSSFVDYGGAIHYIGGAGRLTIRNTVFDGCSAVGDGGALNVTSCRELALDTVTFTNNSCGSEGQGGLSSFP